MDSHQTCPSNCPGCAHRHLTASESRQQKQEWLFRKLNKWRNCIQPIQVPGVDQQHGYREKVCLSAHWADGHWNIGLMHRDAVVPIPDCPVHSPCVRDAMACFSKALPPASEFPMVYYVQSGAQVTLVLKSREMPSLAWITPYFIERLERIGIKGVWIHRHPSAGKRVFAKNRWDLAWGEKSATDTQGLVYGPTTFQQLIPILFNQALDTAESFLAPAPEDLVIDLYSGIGGSLARWSRRSSQIIGVELNGESIACAAANAPSVAVLRGSCRDRLPQLSGTLAVAHQKRLIYANPPRTGIESDVRKWIAGEFRPEKIAYLSCSAGTLNRDLDEFQKQGFCIEQIHPFDFFPKTHHVEALALLRLNPAGFTKC